MKKARVLILMLTLCLLITAFCPAALAVGAEPDITARHAIVIELNTGAVLYEKDADETALPASTTKIMTALITCEAIEKGTVSLDDLVTAKAEDVYLSDPDASNAGISAGEKMTLRDLCYCMMLPSANEAANVVASHVAGSVNGFVAMMNDKAGALGCKSTHFANTNGLPAGDHYTTARELAMITQEALKYDLFRELCGASEYTVPATNVSGERELSNSNAIINPDSFYGSSYYLEGAYGVKTGHLSDAGYCLVSAVKRGDLDLLCVVLGSDGSMENYYFRNFTDTATLVDYCEKNFHFKTVIRAAEVVGSIAVDKGKQETLSVSPAEDIGLLLSDDVDTASLQRIISYDYDAVPAPVKKGAAVGRVEVKDSEGNTLCTCELVANEDVEASFFAYAAAKIKAFLLKLLRVAAIIALILIVVAFAAVFLKHKRKGKKK